MEIDELCENIKKFTIFDNNDISNMQLGLRGENFAKTVLEEKFNISLIKYENKHSHFDFHNKENNKLFEIKTRRINLEKYETTYIPYTKLLYINKIKQKNKECEFYFCIIFYNAIALLKYNEDKFKTYKISKYNNSNTYRNTLINAKLSDFEIIKKI